MSPWQPRTGAQRIIPDHCRTQTVHRVCVAETDMMGIVHHANYVLLFERGRLAYLRQRGLPYKEMVERGYHMPVVELNARYRKPAYFDDLLWVETRLGALSRVTVRFNYVVSRPKPDAREPAELLLEGHILLACVDEKNRPRPLPEDVVRTLFLPEISASDDLVIPDSRADRVGSA
ncbi:MAG: thioesterase family protein [Deltaproteobacteria bacterium]